MLADRVEGVLAAVGLAPWWMIGVLLLSAAALTRQFLKFFRRVNDEVFWEFIVQFFPAGQRWDYTATPAPWLKKDSGQSGPSP